MELIKNRVGKFFIVMALFTMPLQSSAEWFHVVYAEYLYYLAKHSENSYHDQSNRIVIGVYGSPAMYEATKHMSLSKVVKGKAIQVTLMSSLSETEKFHIVFIGKDKVSELPKAIEVCKKDHVMLTSDISGSIVEGSDMEFFKDPKGNIKFKIGSKKEGVKLSSIIVNMAGD